MVSLYAVMFRIEPPHELLGWPLRYELEVFYDTCLPKGRKMSFDSPEEKLTRMGYKELSGNIDDYIQKSHKTYGGILAFERENLKLLVFPEDDIINAIRLMQEESFSN
jgi:hypothetical protein